MTGLKVLSVRVAYVVVVVVVVDWSVVVVVVVDACFAILFLVLLFDVCAEEDEEGYEYLVVIRV